MLDYLIDLNTLGDDRGSLIVLEKGNNLPFDLKRTYYIYGTKQDIRRGFHAHKELQQMAICINGSCKILLDDGKEKINIELQSKEQGLLIPPMVWHEMYDFSDDCVLMVCANDYYDENDYIRDYEKFIKVPAHDN